jgi:hypothetical protein
MITVNNVETEVHLERPGQPETPPEASPEDEARLRQRMRRVLRREKERVLRTEADG